jgi:hypothetical protein
VRRSGAADTIALGRVDATNVGRLLAASGTSDIADAHVVICARRTSQQVVTSDPDDLLAEHYGGRREPAITWLRLFELMDRSDTVNWHLPRAGPQPLPARDQAGAVVAQSHPEPPELTYAFPSVFEGFLYAERTVKSAGTRDQRARLLSATVESAFSRPGTADAALASEVDTLLSGLV